MPNPNAGCATIDAATDVGAVHLTVAELGRSVAFYRDAIGLDVVDTRPTAAVLGISGDPLVHLVEDRGAPPSRGHTGLFHLALRVPERVALARWLGHAARQQIPVTGMSDHFVSEAIYLDDPDEHGIEIYWDRPRATWEGRVAEMTTAPLDIEDLLRELPDPRTAEFEGLPAGTDMGHVHLKIRDVPEAVDFYRDVLGFALMTTYGSQAAFLAAGGYHHHIGANSWQSRGAPAPPPGTAALRHVTIALPTSAARDATAGRVADSGQEPIPTEAGVMVRDPSGNALLLSAG